MFCSSTVFYCLVMRFEDILRAFLTCSMCPAEGLALYQTSLLQAHPHPNTPSHPPPRTSLPPRYRRVRGSQLLTCQPGSVLGHNVGAGADQASTPSSPRYDWPSRPNPSSGCRRSHPLRSVTCRPRMGFSGHTAHWRPKMADMWPGANGLGARKGLLDHGNERQSKTRGPRRS